LLYDTCTAALAWRSPGSSPSRNRLGGGLERDRVSSERQPERGAGRERQALAAACRARGWRPLELVEDAGLAAHERSRAGVEQALRVLERGEANALVAAKSERLCQALGELAALLASAQRQGWALVALDCALETTTPAAEASASVLATFAHCERRSVSERTRAALALARAQGVRLGRPPQMSPHAIERIRRERAAGRSLAAIADGLNADRIPTAQGGRRWYPGTVRYTLKRTR
jgi:DNA invertase Pin-like site-specific DNA recombinase